MAQSSCYTYQMRITQDRIVHTEQRNPRQELIGQPSGQFGYSGEVRERIQALSQAATRNTIVAEETRELGVLLARVLFEHVLLRDFLHCYEQARTEGAFVRLELDIDERLLPEVAALPWEWMSLPTPADHQAIWFATDPHLALVRRREQWRTPTLTPLPPGQRLRVALAIAAPATLGPIKDERIWESLCKLPSSSGNLFTVLEPVRHASSELLDQLLENRPHLLHLIGHGRFLNEAHQEVGQFALLDDPEFPSDEPLWIDAGQFSSLFSRHTPHVVVLQACEGGTLSASQAFVGIASQIVQQSVPIVIAMQYEVSNITAQRFMVEFYKHLAQGDPVEKAVQEGRRKVALGPQSYTTRDFATPVIFMSAQNGLLFASPAVQHAAQPTQSAAQDRITYNVRAENGGIAVGKMDGGTIQQNRMV